MKSLLLVKVALLGVMVGLGTPKAGRGGVVDAHVVHFDLGNAARQKDIVGILYAHIVLAGGAHDDLRRLGGAEESAFSFGVTVRLPSSLTFAVT